MQGAQGRTYAQWEIPSLDTALHDQLQQLGGQPQPAVCQRAQKTVSC